MEFKTINEILDFAINNEQTACDFYNKLSSESNDKVMKETFSSYAKEEKAHKMRLVKIKETGVYNAEEKEILDLKISDYLVSTKTSENMTYQDALILAMKREKAAYKLYMKLSQIAPNDDLKNIFKNLAADEAKHKLRFEIEYDDVIYREN